MHALAEDRTGLCSATLKSGKVRRSLCLWLSPFSSRSARTHAHSHLRACALTDKQLCRRKATTGFVYCGYHLPLDPLSGYMYCTHLKVGGKTCGNPVLKDSDRLCKYHRPANEGGQARAAAVDQHGNFDDMEDDDDM